MVARPLFSVLPLVFIAGAFVCLLLVVLAGIKDVAPLNEIFFLTADTSSIPSASMQTQWTLWNACTGLDGKNFNCTEVVAAYPFQPSAQLNDMNVAADFANNSGFYFYASRVQFAFFLIAVTFTGLGSLLGFFALCSRIGGGVSSFFAICGLISSIVAAGLMTSLWVKAASTFNSFGQAASIGVKAFALGWTAVALSFLATIGFCGACCAGRGEHSLSGRSLFRNNKAADEVPSHGSF